MVTTQTHECTIKMLITMINLSSTPRQSSQNERLHVRYRRSLWIQSLQPFLTLGAIPVLEIASETENNPKWWQSFAKNSWRETEMKTAAPDWWVESCRWRLQDLRIIVCRIRDFLPTSTPTIFSGDVNCCISCSTFGCPWRFPWRASSLNLFHLSTLICILEITLRHTQTCLM
jgi:hypothetical protein